MSDRCSGFVARCCIRRVRGFAVAACAAPTVGWPSSRRLSLHTTFRGDVRAL
ncbi:hypothetical protein AZ78_3101 [Lysobacter capsici AZ78]|uniref:Uncharacterized protein n=1 Tax=Lysobacter capsici AZ78 TaxID=1444315 RepID=A0A108UAH9_9GAMM|nr:hypothetical protein AZ78_3101 [Lysobacter capsici AZ78]